LLSVFKKGPDYIDAAWLSWASGTVCRNLDTYMVAAERVKVSFAHAAEGSELAVIEGNRGLFDGKDAAGTHSTASLARLLDAPVVLVVDGTKVTRTVAALVKGCQLFEPDLKLAGVVLNHVTGDRHRRIITEAIAEACNLPVVGCIPRLGEAAGLIPGRHLGLVTPSEFGDDSELARRLSEIGERYLDIDKLLETAAASTALDVAEVAGDTAAEQSVRLGYFHDSVFTFYYPENLEALRNGGAELVPISSLEARSLPEIDGLYIGGGFPETHAEPLSRNRALCESVRKAAENGLPIYAECGGLIFLCRTLVYRDGRYPMAGVFPVDLQMQKKPVGHGYSELTVDTANPFFAVGEVLRGHEFHYTGPIGTLAGDLGCMKVQTGVGLGNGRDGLLYKNCLAGYTHLHASGLPGWAESFVRSAYRYRTAERSSATNRRTTFEMHKHPAPAPVAGLGRG
jgi:cobyrinic acid a,c-diamide synthase